VGLDAHAELGTELAAVRDDAFTERLPGSVVRRQRLVNVVGIGKRLRQRLLFSAGLGRRKPDMGTGRRRRIAHQCRATECQAGRAEIVNRPKERLIDVVADKSRLLPASAQSSPCAPAAAALRIRIRNLGHPCTSVSTWPRPQRDTSPNCSAGNRYAIHRPLLKSGSPSLKLVPQEERVIGKHSLAGLRQKIGFIWRAAPNEIAGVDRLHLRSEATTHTRSEPVAPDDEIGTLAAPVCEMKMDAAAVLLDVLEHVSEVIVLSIDGLQQDLP
jgi:hypothetical protein